MKKKEIIKKLLTRDCDLCKLQKTLKCPNSYLCLATFQRPFFTPQDELYRKYAPQYFPSHEICSLEIVVNAQHITKEVTNE